MEKLINKLENSLTEFKKVINKVEKNLEELKSLNKFDLPNDLGESVNEEFENKRNNDE